MFVWNINSPNVLCFFLPSSFHNIMVGVVNHVIYMHFVHIFITSLILLQPKLVVGFIVIYIIVEKLVLSDKFLFNRFLASQELCNTVLKKIWFHQESERFLSSCLLLSFEYFSYISFFNMVIQANFVYSRYGLIPSSTISS